jgi:hypothetical protein
MTGYRNFIVLTCGLHSSQELAHILFFAVFASLMNMDRRGSLFTGNYALVAVWEVIYTFVTIEVQMVLVIAER